MNDRLKKALHYVIHCAQSKNLNLGGVKLLKIIVFSDVIAFRDLGDVITGAKIVKAPQGPVPNGHQEALAALESEGKILITKSDRQYEPTKFKSLTSPDITGFEVDELAIMTELATEFCGRYSATALSGLTHNRSWEIAEMGEEIPLASYLGRMVSPTPDDMAQITAELSAAGMNGEFTLDAC